ncbi:hypothetical protein M1L60_05390 [Actinoplanes sp. TRM 88003]|uniref:Uncharacterized protein n=1 Tax=Paractinoplanes aksuensis TaxID=2939490 RepID=A0ABT1DIY4_9ACTN|nr:hypothetical protein [Actinoplanes aksuensis]MCO8270025.1 hypothetical protein [Actinoplanes aksuensis]
MAGTPPSMAGTPPSMARLSTEITAYLMAELGCDVRSAALVIATVGDMAIDSHLTVEALDAPVPGVAGGPTGRDPTLRLVDAAAVGGEAVAVAYADVTRAAVGSPGRPSAWWRDKIELVLDGVEYRLQREPVAWTALRLGRLHVD